MNNLLKQTFFMCLLMLVIIVPEVSCSSKMDEIKIQYSLEKERELQEAVDNGHQPWRLIPVDVAHEAVISFADKNIKHERCILIFQKGEEASVQCNGNNMNYKVYLKSFFGKNSIWTAVKIQPLKD